MRIETSGDVSYMIGLLTDRSLSTQADGEKERCEQVKVLTHF